MADTRVLIIGGGVASASAIETLLAKGIAGSAITLLSADTELPYHRPPLSKGYLLGREPREKIFVKPHSFYDDAGVTLRLGTLVRAVDAQARTVITATGDTLTFEKLLIATGCTPRTLSAPGSDLPGIFTLRTLADCDALRKAVSGSRTAVVIGGSFIGMELASAFAQHGLTTTLLHRGTAVFDKLGFPEASAFFADYFTERGVTIRYEDEVVTITRASGGRLAMQTKRGNILETDLVAVGVGVTPDIGLFDGSGIRTENGIVVNEVLESSVEGIFAAGDVANFFDPLYGRLRRIEHWETAITHGKIAGQNIAARTPDERVAYSGVSSFFSDVFDLTFEYFGDALGTDRSVTRGSFADHAVTVFFLAGSTVRAAFTMGRPRERRALLGLIQNKHEMTDPERLADTKSPLPS